MTSGNRDQIRPGDGARALAVVSDGSAFAQSGPAAVEPALREHAEMISGLARVPARPVLIEAADSAQLTAGLRALPGDLGAVLLTHTDPERGWTVQQDRRDTGGPPVVTDEDATAIALTAALLAALTQHGRSPQGARVVIAGARCLPVLAPLLVAAGLGDLTTWNTSDGAAFPLRRVVSGADAVIDLVDGLPAAAAERGSEMTVLTGDDAPAAPCAAAGLLRAARHLPEADLDVEVYRACALALVLSTPPDHHLPHGKRLELADVAADAADRVLRARPVHP